MSSLMQTVMQQLGPGLLKEISGKLGEDEAKVGTAVSAALPTMLGALARNATKGDGAESLHKALSSDHDGSILNNLGGFLGNAESGPGAGILKHLFGGSRGTVENGLSRASGLGSDSTGQLLTMLAPIVMGALGKTRKEQGMDVSSLAGFLSQEREQVKNAAPKGLGGLESLLDADGDGDVDLGDFTKGGGLLGKLFGG